MTNYTQSTNFATKDALTSGDPLKILKGTEINTEFANIAIAVATKADLVSPTFVTPALGTPSSGVMTNVTGLPLTTGVTGTLPVANGGTGVTSSTGSGNNVLSTSPTLVTPILGTPTSGVLTNTTGLPLTTGVTGTLPVANGGTGVTVSTGTGSTVLSTSPTLVTPVLGTPTSGTLTNCTGLPVSTGISGLAANVATFLATPSSANLAAVLTDETGTGANVFATSPTLVTPALGTPSSGTLTNCTFPTLNQNTTGSAATLTTTVNSGVVGTTQATSTNNTTIATTAFVQAVMQTLHPVGSIYINATNSTNPGTLLGFGTWTAFGAGRVPVGFDSTNVLFDTAEETGGSATSTLPSHTHTFTGSALASHTHQIGSRDSTANDGGGSSQEFVNDFGTGGGAPATTSSVSGGTPAGTNSTEGASATNANYQPYITVYMWKRTV